MKKKLVILTGAGMSAESGIKTFRDMNGLWENYDVMEVASYQGWLKNKQRVLNFYNERRTQLSQVVPNAGHYDLVKFEDYFDVQIITQNIDDLHERAGSKKVLHLHGELTKARSSEDDNLIYDIGYQTLSSDSICKRGFQLRPHVVWFSEDVKEIYNAIELVAQADIFIVIGISLVVYLAANLLHNIDKNIPVCLIDPSDMSNYFIKNI